MTEEEKLVPAWNFELTHIYLCCNQLGTHSCYVPSRDVCHPQGSSSPFEPHLSVSIDSKPNSIACGGMLAGAGLGDTSRERAASDGDVTTAGPTGSQPQPMILSRQWGLSTAAAPTPVQQRRAGRRLHAGGGGAVVCHVTLLQDGIGGMISDGGDV